MTICFALLGIDDDALALAGRLIAAKHRLVCAAGLDSEQMRRVHELAPTARPLPGWEELLHEKGVDRVLLASGGLPANARVDALRKLAQAGVPVVTLHPVCEAINAFEIEMIQADTGCPLTACFPGLHTPALLHARNWVFHSAQSPVGPIEQVAVERTVTDRTDENIRRCLARDAEWVRQLAGRIRRVSGITQERKGALANLSAQMVSQDGIVIRWTVLPGSDDRVRMRLIGAADSVSAVMTESEIHSEPPEALPASDPWEGATVAVESLGSQPLTPTWPELSHSLEVAETIERSAARGKTLELLDEPHTEESTFKGMMAVGGCGLMLLTFVLMLAWSIFEGVRFPYARNEYEKQRRLAAEQAKSGTRPQAVGGRSRTGATAEPRPGWPLWLRIWPVYPFAIFLLLQLFSLVFQQKPARGRADPPPPDCDD